MEEKWQDIETNYRVSNTGKIYSMLSHKYLKFGVLNTNYFYVYINKKTKLIHRLVAEAFISNPNNLPEVNHINGDKQNNHVNNLEWCTHAENQKHASVNNLMAVGEKHGRHKLTEIQVNEIRALRNKLSQRKIANLYNVTPMAINFIFKNKNWKLS